jgi:hypothetical protein
MKAIKEFREARETAVANELSCKIICPAMTPDSFNATSFLDQICGYYERKHKMPLLTTPVVEAHFVTLFSRAEEWQALTTMEIREINFRVGFIWSISATPCCC